jgi:hypothetical protein
MRVAELDDVTYDLEVDGEQVRRTLHRRVWERGGWATVAIAFQDLGRNGEWQPAKLALIRLQRVRDAWRKHAALTLRGVDAAQLGEALRAWSDALAPGAPEAPEPAAWTADDAGDADADDAG